MASTKRQDGRFITVTAKAATGAVSGVPIIEEGYIGIPQTTVAEKERYSLDISTDVQELPTSLIETAGPFKKGEIVYINEESPFKLQVVKLITEAKPSKTRVFGMVFAVPADGYDQSNTSPAAGFIAIKQGPIH